MMIESMFGSREPIPTPSDAEAEESAARAASYVREVVRAIETGPCDWTDIRAKLDAALSHARTAGVWCAATSRRIIVTDSTLDGIDAHVERE